FLAVEARSAAWKPLAHNGLHDPGNPALDLLQEPAEALSRLPANTAGNMVDWVEALREGYIDPRTNINPETEVNIRETDVIMKNTGSANFVRFPHKAHTEWLDCDNCHDHLFAREVGKTPMTMLLILSGEYCGRCHGAVAFPLTECNRCHSVAPFAADQ
nr:cytochrome c3 family protein [Gammaproteobacteria bacterium]